MGPLGSLLTGRRIPHFVRLEAEAKPGREGRNRKRRGENRRDSARNRLPQLINRPGLHGGSAANSVSEFSQLITGKLVKIGGF
jgi:hypothetical protein